MLNLPSIAVLRSFEAAARFESFTGAATELRIHQAAVSRQVRELEGIIGTPLFRKEGRGIALTAAGKRLALEVKDHLQSLNRTIETAKAAGQSGRVLAIAALPTLSARWLAPRISAFKQAHPDVALLVYSRSEPFDLVRQGIDLAFHFGGPDWVEGDVEPLCPESLLLVASPVLAERSNIQSIADCIKMPKLHLMTRKHLWPSFLEELGKFSPDAWRGTQFDQFAPLISAAVAGVGAAIVPSYLIESELAQGVLVPLAAPTSNDGAYYTVTPKGTTNPDAETFRAWVQQEAEVSSKRRRHFESGKPAR
ncbi:MAG: LysR substrate-binding domain-containing protein [Pseudomonadota bacterium]